MLTQVPSPERMNQWDAATAALGLPTFTLMENAARAAWHVLHDCVDTLQTCRVLILMGSGNNGGDAVALARMLHDEGIKVRVIHTRPLRALRGIAASHASLARASGVVFSPVRHWLTAHSCTYPEWTTPDVFIDGLLGTGFAGTGFAGTGFAGTGFTSNLRPEMEALIKEVNTRAALSHAFVFSLDVPSGLCASTGLVQSTAIKANATVTFEAAKPGLVLPHAKAYTGILHTKSIGIPACIPQRLPAACALLDEKIVQVYPPSTHFTHKGKAGHVLIIGGSTGLCGAPLLTAKGALAAGVGKVTLAMPAPLFATLSMPADIMTIPLPVDYWQDCDTIFAALQSILAQVDCVVLGPGIGRNEQSRAFVARLLQARSCPQSTMKTLPFVIDADALYAIAKNPQLCTAIKASDVLTPHPGEAATFLQSSTASIQYERFASLAKLQATTPHNPVWVLKGAGTLVGQMPNEEPCEEVSCLNNSLLSQMDTYLDKYRDKCWDKCLTNCLISPFDVPQLAVAGSGDVLAGIIGCFVAQKIPPLYAAGLGVYRHAQAGLHLAKKAPYRGTTGSDIAEILCESL